VKTLALLQGLRFVDSFFPSGGYAFSSGLETAVAEGAVRDAEGLSAYVTDALEHGLGRCDAVAVACAHEAAMTGDLSKAFRADAELEAMKLGRSTRLASRQMGRQVLRLAAMQHQSSTVLRDYLGSLEAARTAGHFATALGLVLGAAGWTREQAVAAFLYHSAVGYVSASLKLMPIGQREAQRLLDGWAPLIARLSEAAVVQPPMTAWTPLQDIHAMRQVRLTTRLFRS
jgi:urease accessory protein